MNIKTTFENYSKSFYDYDKQKRNSQSIFVSIVSYRDPNIINTINSLILNAKNPESITLSIVACVFKNPEKWILELEAMVENISKATRVKIILHSVEASKQYHLGELKNISNKDYNKEDFYLSVSSSSEFDPYWDDILIKQFNTISYLRNNNNFIITCNPRGFLQHDNIVPGYVFFTNHKTNVSFQREEYDGTKVIISGYNPFINEDTELPGKGLYNSEDFKIHLKETLMAEDFLKKYNFVKFNDRKFVKDEYISISNGVSEKFIFSDAKQYFKINKINDSCIDKEDFNFISYINFIKNNFSVLALRWIPIYHLYDENFISISRPSPADNYKEKNILESESYQYINNMVNEIITGEDKQLAFNINSNLSVDWENKEFKKLSSFSADNIISAINSFISFYNFSTNENSLHWNNRYLV